MISPYCYPGLVEPPPRTPAYQPTLEEVIEVVCEHTGIPVSELVRKTRLREYVRARHLVMWLTHVTNSRITVSAIGRRLIQDHTTIIHGREAIRRDMEQEPGLKETVDQLIMRIQTLNYETLGTRT